MSQQSNQPATTEPTEPANQITTIITTSTNTNENNNNEANTHCILCGHTSTLALPIPIPPFLLRHAIPDFNPNHTNPDPDESTHLPRLPTVCQSCDHIPFERKLHLICAHYEDKIKRYKDKAKELVKETRPLIPDPSEWEQWAEKMASEVKKNENMAYYLGEEKKWALGMARMMWEGASGQETARLLEEGKRDDEEAEEEVKLGEQANEMDTYLVLT